MTGSIGPEDGGQHRGLNPYPPNCAPPTMAIASSVSPGDISNTEDTTRKQMFIIS